MARKRKSPEEETPLAPGEQTAEEIHATRREAEREARAASGLDRHGKRANEKRGS